MAGLHLSDEEQGERIKAWWRANGVSVIAGAVLGIAVIGGVNYWRSYQADQAEAASALYEQMLNDPDAPAAAEAGDTLVAEYAGTPYAGKAALLLAAHAVRADDLAGAIERLEWAVAEAADPADRRLARLRLARAALGAGDTDRAENALTDLDSGGYESEYRELLGDLAMARQDPGGAREEYEAALAALPEQSGFAGMLNRKLEAAIGASK